MISKRVIIHAGYPKAASTYLQRKLFKNHSEISEFSDQNYNNSDQNKMIEAMRRISCTESFNFDLDHWEKTISKIINNIPSNRKILISFEGLISPGRADRKIIIRRLRKIFKNAGIIIIIRNQEDILRSTCFQHMRKNKLYDSFRDINDWLENPLKHSKHLTTNYNHPINRIKYYPVVRYYEKKFGRENILILKLEELKCDKSIFIKKLSRFCKINEEEALNLTSGKDKVNKRRSRKKAVTYEFLEKNSFLSLGAKFLPERFKETAIKIIPIKEFDTSFNSKWSKKITKIAKSDNQKLDERYGLNLKEYGYTI